MLFKMQNSFIIQIIESFGRFIWLLKYSISYLKHQMEQEMTPLESNFPIVSVHSVSVLLQKACMTLKWCQKALNYLAIICRIVHKPEMLGFIKMKITTVPWILECLSLSLIFNAFLPSQDYNIWEFKMPNTVHNIMQHTNTLCEKFH